MPRVISKLVPIVVTASICLPLGALLREDASADPRNERVMPIEGHRHLANAQELMHRVVIELQASKRDDEPLWRDKTGRAKAVGDAVEKAHVRIDRTAAWVREGMAGTEMVWRVQGGLPWLRIVPGQAVP